MWLLNTSNLELEEFYGDIPKYAILSHTWARDEISFREMRKMKNWASTVKKAGFVKIQQTCLLALQDNLRYAWVDSCCIDKSSSAELSEAINSMYAWYRNATVCYTYLEDVSQSEIDPRASTEDEFTKCRWFTRGWTLQELLASEHLRFYSNDWTLIGMKEDLIERISSITGIHQSALRNDGSAERTSAAQKMNWASKRITTRVEDQAYCLMGIFDVHMPLLYGESIKAFQRLQLEIIKTCSDDSIFAFQKSSGLGGALAHQPSDFQDAAGIRRGIRHRPYFVANTGLQIHGTIIGGDEQCSGECAIFAAGGAECGHEPCYFILESRFHPDDCEFGQLDCIGVRLQPINIPQKIFARFAHAPLQAVMVSDLKLRWRGVITIVLSGMAQAKDDHFKDRRAWMDAE
ncbi:hypothetical protein EG328_006951 [Venturia inaequalis]|uniref:Heterokaryon incompatibility domain-containing protein n=1 Tax=Venturia inaequalis TaxID=5025 RepID=A0A8H3UEW1_VENIN|nr:hypothetical protein EG328_006951 [Venturia inaequalis]RDI83683.1 hypothetical protein Vi05172_g6244 [Venturia inaequalis]